MCLLSQAAQPRKSKKLQGSTIFNKFKVSGKIGAGCFGEIYLAQSQDQSGKRYALKAEAMGSKQQQLLLEAQIYKFLHSEGELPGIPRVYRSGVEAKHNLMLMDLLGQNLQDALAERGPFPLPVVLVVGLQMIDRIQNIHSKGFIHRDIKPDNIAFGLSEQSKTIFLFDMGLCNKYLNRHNEHIPFRQDRVITGTALYASIATHRGYEQSRRDDIESIGYVLLYLLFGGLPWQNLKATSMKQISDVILKKKLETSVEVLCHEVADELADFIGHARRLEFSEEPDYEYLRSLMKCAAERRDLKLQEYEAYWE